MKVSRTCIITGKTNTLDIDITAEQLAAVEAGAVIQDIMPNVSRAEREFIKTGITPQKWRALFGELNEAKLSGNTGDE
jgi:hypothetical protein